MSWLVLGALLGQESQNFRQAFCVFNAVETVDSIGGTGIDIESLIRAVGVELGSKLEECEKGLGFSSRWAGVKGASRETPKVLGLGENTGQG